MQLTASAERVRVAAEGLGLDITVVEMPASTRTAAEAAAACGCSVGQIVKSLVFVGATTGKPYLLLVAGTNRVDETGVAHVLGEALTRPNATRVREITGYAIGGIPPFGHTAPLETLIDRDLLAYHRVWAAAGTPNAVFAVDPRRLQAATAARAIAVA